MKMCSKCKEFKKTNDFYKNRAKKDGLQTMCKECVKENDRKRVKTGENKLRCKKKYETMMSNEKYANSERERKRLWREENREKHNEINRAHYYNNKFSYYLSNEKRRSLLESLPKTFTENEWEECKKSFDYKCAYCGSNDKSTQEHFIPVSKGGEYTKDNILPVCSSCNSSKRDREFFEWYPRHKSYSKEREKKILKYLNYNSNKVQQLGIL